MVNSTREALQQARERIVALEDRERRLSERIARQRHALMVVWSAVVWSDHPALVDAKEAVRKALPARDRQQAMEAALEALREGKTHDDDS